MGPSSRLIPLVQRSFHIGNVPSAEKRRKMRLDVFNRRQKAKLQQIEQVKLSAGGIPPSQPSDYPQDNSKNPTADKTPISQHLKDSTNEEPGMMSSLFSMRMFYYVALKHVVNTSNLLSKNAKL